MKKLFKFVYTFWAALAFSVIFLFLAPFLFIVCQKEAWHRGGFWLYKLWAWAFYIAIGMPAQVTWRFKPQKGAAYVFCPNHASYFDIPSMSLRMHDDFMFVGKSSLSKIPLFGYQFDKLNISVDRNNPRSAYKTFERAKEAIAKGKSVVMFPEGGTTDTPPKMRRFKDGPFRVAIEQQRPIVPVTIPFNWIIHPAVGKALMTWHRNLVVFHEPIPTEGLTLDDVNELKEKTYQIIEQELQKHLKKT